MKDKELHFYNEVSNLFHKIYGDTDQKELPKGVNMVMRIVASKMTVKALEKYQDMDLKGDSNN